MPVLRSIADHRPPALGTAPEGRLSLLDGRYQLIRQLSGPAQAPLMVASDLTTGRVVCVRLQRFTAALTNLTAVPLLAVDQQPLGDGPLLPYDFGVDEGTSYLVREFVTATNLLQLLGETTPLSALAIISLLRRAGDAMLTASAQGFCHPGLALRHVLLASDGSVRVSGYDTLRLNRHPEGFAEGAMLAALLPQVFTDTLAHPGSDPERPGRPYSAATNRPHSAPDAGTVRALLVRCQVWQRTTLPDLATVVRELRRCEDQLQGYSRTRELLTIAAGAVAALFRRFRHLGPLLHPYVVVLALVVAVVGLAVRALSASAGPGRLVVYPLPTRAADASLATYPFSNPPITVAATAVPPAPTVLAPAASTAAVVTPPGTAADTVTAAPAYPAPPAPRIPPASPQAPPRQAPSLSVSRQPVAEPPTRVAAVRVVTSVASPTAVSRAAPAIPTAVVIVTRLTAQQTTARVTVIGATETGSASSVAATVRATTTSFTQGGITSTHGVITNSVRVTATSVASTSAATPSRNAAPQAAIVRR